MYLATRYQLPSETLYIIGYLSKIHGVYIPDKSIFIITAMRTPNLIQETEIYGEIAEFRVKGPVSQLVKKFTALWTPNTDYHVHNSVNELNPLHNFALNY